MKKNIYNKVESTFDFQKREQEVVIFWEENNIFQKSVAKNENKKNYIFFDGPPTANGRPHIGHILTRAMKDIIPRYKTMKGFCVERKAGWDTHGLPVELEIEKELNINSKEQIEEYGVDNFISKCKESVFRYKNEWEEMSKKVGFFADFLNPYITYDDNYIESVWWAIKQLYEKGLLYKGHKVVPYCPRCGTALSSHEVAQGYKDVSERSVIAKFFSKEGVFLAWTTTPWTLPSNVALCVNPDVEYAYVKCKDESLKDEKELQYIVAKELVAKVFSCEVEIIKVVRGKELENIKYSPLYKSLDVEEQGGYIITCGDYVTTKDGTGIVHIAPAFGEDDSQIANKYDLPFLKLVDDRGRLTFEAFQGVFCKDADKLIIEDLKKNDLLFDLFSYKHSYPFCWRCDTPLIYFAKSSWFVAVTKAKEQLLKNNDSINWIPENIKKGRMGNFLDNIIDWGISRDRYWGTPLPIFCCECGEIAVIGSKEELEQRSGKTIIELHKPYIDEISIPCKCGKQMTREKAVVDCWFDSGAMPFAQLHYPFENKEKFLRSFPADYICEAIDQTRGWFYTLLAESTLLFDKASYKNCLVLGHVNDKYGQKMSKHKGNSVFALDALNHHGADAIRWFFYTASAPWLNSRYSEDAIIENERKFLRTYWSVYSFYVLYADIDNFVPNRYKMKYESLNMFDRWIISEINELIKRVDDNLKEYNIYQSARAIQDFMENLSNWYIRRNRERFWANGMSNDKINAFKTLFYVLKRFSLLTAPFIPFMTENIYQNIIRNIDNRAKESIHLCNYPRCEKSKIDNELNLQMRQAVKICELGRKIRNTHNLKNRQPLRKAIIASASQISNEFLKIIQEELNTKEIEITSDIEKYVSIVLKPELRTIGKQYSTLVNEIKKYLKDNSSVVYREINANQRYIAKLCGEEIELNKQNVLISFESKGEYAAASYEDFAVVLDTMLDESLLNEGFVREFISKIQALRKEKDFEVIDRIALKIYCNAKEQTILQEFRQDIANKILASKLEMDECLGGELQININGTTIGVDIQKINYNFDQ